MIYPKKLNSKKSNYLVNAFMVCSIIISIILIVINKITSPMVPWAHISIAGIVYIWITVLYSLKRNTNIASHVLVQIIAISGILLYIDNELNFYGWSMFIGIPIVVIVANITMLVLAIVCHKEYVKYAIYQLIIVLLSITHVTFALSNSFELRVLNYISLGISLTNLVISLILSYKEFYKTIVCKFHM